MPTLDFPSETFPAMTGVAVEAPSAWQPFDAGDTALALVREAPAGAFAPNVVVTVRRFPASYSLADAVRALQTVLVTLPAFDDRTASVGEAAGREVGGLPGYGSHVVFTDAAAGPLWQAIGLCVVPRGAVVDVVDLRATVPADAALAGVYDEARGIAATLAFPATR